MTPKTKEDITRAKSTLAEAKKTRDAWNNIVAERTENLAKVQEAYEKGEQARNEDLMLRYLAHLGWEKSEYRKRSVQPAGCGAEPQRILRVAAASPDMIPDGHNCQGVDFSYFTQTTMGAKWSRMHAILLAAAKDWEATR